MLREAGSPSSPADGATLEEPAATAATPATRRRAAAAAAIVAVVLAAAGWLQFGPTLGLSFAYDDVDCLDVAARVMTGDHGYWHALLRPHNEHLMPLMRAAFDLSARWFGIDARPLRVAILAAHVTTAWLLAMAALRWSRRPSAAMATGLAYLVPCGLSSMMVWVPVAAGVPVGTAGIAGALLALAHRDRLGPGRARLLAGLGGLWALAAGTGLIPLLLAPLLVDELQRRGEGDRRVVGPFALLCLAAMAAAGLAALYLHARVYGRAAELNPLLGIPPALFLVAVTPYRYLLPGLGLPVEADPGASVLLWSSVGAALALPVAALLLALWRRGLSPLARVTLATVPGALGGLLLVGAGRWKMGVEYLYEADRYFFGLLLPLALLAGAVTAEVADRMRGWDRRRRAAVIACCLLAVAAETALHRRAMSKRIPWDVFATHAQRFEQLAGLAALLAERAATLPAESPPLRYPSDGMLWLSGIHNNVVSGSLLLRVIGSETPRLRLGREPVSERDAAILNPLLAEWAAPFGQAGVPAVIEGRLVRRAASVVDFRKDAQDFAVVSGFHAWESSYRWMSRRGELRLSLGSPTLYLLLSAPVQQIRARHGWDAITVQVAAVDEETGSVVRLGSVRVVSENPSTHLVDASPFVARFGGRPARLILEADHTWRPSDVLPGSADPRELSVIVMAAGSP